MKKKNLKTLSLQTITIAKIDSKQMKNIKGASEPVSLPGGLSALGSQCGNQICH